MDGYFEKTKEELVRLGLRERNDFMGPSWLLSKEICSTDCMTVQIDASVYSSYFRLQGFVKSKTSSSYIEIYSQMFYAGESVENALAQAQAALKERLTRLVLTLTVA